MTFSNIKRAVSYLNSSLPLTSVLFARVPNRCLVRDGVSGFKALLPLLDPKSSMTCLFVFGSYHNSRHKI